MAWMIAAGVLPHAQDAVLRNGWAFPVGAVFDPRHVTALQNDLRCCVFLGLLPTALCAVGTAFALVLASVVLVIYYPLVFCFYIRFCSELFMKSMCLRSVDLARIMRGYFANIHPS